MKRPPNRRISANPLTVSKAKVTASVETARLSLVPGSPDLSVALIDGLDAFNAISTIRLAEGYRDFLVSDHVSEAWLTALRTRAEADVWQDGFFILERESGLAIGTAAFVGPPDASGTVEIAYAIVPTFEGRGFATEAAGGLIRYAEGTGRVHRIRAHTLPESNASTRVLEKCGFERVGVVEDPEDGIIWRWERRVPGRET